MPLLKKQSRENVCKQSSLHGRCVSKLKEEAQIAEQRFSYQCNVPSTLLESKSTTSLMSNNDGVSSCG
eukprot:c41208_g1_i1 orf=3-206(+)